MIIAESIDAVRLAVAKARKRGETVGLVPTMGALHEGHASLMKLARAECDFVVVSVFVNPTQFGPNEDFTRYPRTWDADQTVCREAGVDLLFAPPASEIYPAGFQTFAEVTELQKVFEGAVRPGHFRGVATVVLKLFNIVQPDIAYFGQKDAQQVRVIEQMVYDLAVPVKLRIGTTIREADGLALSSRNRFLDPDLRRQAVVISQALFAAHEAVDQGEANADVLRAAMRASFKTADAAVLDYAEIVDSATFQSIECVTKPSLAIIAARFGTTRLIDNMPLLPPNSA